MRDGQTGPRRKKSGEDGLLVRSLVNIFGFNETDIAAGPADGSGVIDQDLNKQVALILRQLDGEIRIVSDKRRHDIAHDQFFRYGGEMDAAHAGEVCFHEVQRILPPGRGEIAYGIEPAENRIETLMIARPSGSQPAFLLGRNRQDALDPGVLEGESGKPLECFG